MATKFQIQFFGLKKNSKKAANTNHLIKITVTADKP